MSTNISKQKRDDLLNKIKEIQTFISAAPQDENTGNLLSYLSDLEKDVNGKKYGLVFEEHREEIDEVLDTHTPVLTEEKDLFIDNGGKMNFLIEGDNLVYQAHVQSLGRRVQTAKVPNLASLLLADDSSQIRSTVATVEAANTRSGLAELGGFRCNGKVAQDMKNMAAANSIAVHHSNNGLGHYADKALQIKHVQARDVVLAHIAAVATYLLVAAGAECLVFVLAVMVCAGKDDNAHFLVVARKGKRVKQLDVRLRRESVAALGAIDGDLGVMIMR